MDKNPTGRVVADVDLAQGHKASALHQPTPCRSMPTLERLRNYCGEGDFPFDVSLRLQIAGLIDGLLGQKHEHEGLPRVRTGNCTAVTVPGRAAVATINFMPANAADDGYLLRDKLVDGALNRIFGEPTQRDPGVVFFGNNFVVAVDHHRLLHTDDIFVHASVVEPLGRTLFEIPDQVILWHRTPVHEKGCPDGLYPELLDTGAVGHMDLVLVPNQRLPAELADIEEIIHYSQERMKSALKRRFGGRGRRARGCTPNDVP